MSELKVDVLLEHHEGENWTATTPLIKGCLAEEETPEEALETIKGVIPEFIEQDPELLDILNPRPEFRLAEVAINIENTPSLGNE